MAKVYKVTMTVDEGWLDATRRMFSYVEGLEVARIDSIEDAGETNDYFSAEDIEDFTDSISDGNGN